MGDLKTKTVKLLQENSTNKVTISTIDSSWDLGGTYSATRRSINGSASSNACKKFSTYLLLFENRIYVCHSLDLAKQVKQHLGGIGWWDKRLIITTEYDNLNQTDIDYSEYYLIKKTNESNRLDNKNKCKENALKADKFRKLELKRYLKETLFLIELIGINVFSLKERTVNRNRKKQNCKVLSTISIALSSIQTKQQAIDYNKQNGNSVGKSVNFARRQNLRNEFWNNPKKESVSEDCELVLNNQYLGGLVYMSEPVSTFVITKNGSQSLFLINDKPYIGLNFNEKPF